MDDKEKIKELEAKVEELEELIGRFYLSATFSFNGVLDDIDTDCFIDAINRSQEVTDKLHESSKLWKIKVPTK